jgi:hypothetical protein
MKKRNLILQAAVASTMMIVAASANAGALATTFKTYASEVFGTGSSATAITPTALTYQFGVPVAAGQPVTVYVSLSNGAKFTAVPGAGELSCLSANMTATAGTAPVLSTDKTYVSWLMTPATGFSTASTCTFTPALATVDNMDVALSVPGGVVGATFTIDSGAQVLTGVPTGGTNVDTAGVHSGNIATSAAAITGKFIASSAFPFFSAASPAVSYGALETKKIDVTNVIPMALFTAGANSVATNAVNLGAVLFTETAGTQDDGVGGDYTLAKTTSWKAVVTGDFSLAATAAASVGVFIAALPDCIAQVAAPAGGAVTYNATKTTATISGITTPTVNVPQYICMTVKATNTTAILPTQYSATAITKPTVATELGDSIASTNLLKTELNGAVVVSRNYIPAAVTGYIQTFRLINTGKVAAVPSVTLIGQDGVAGTTMSLGTSIAVGGTLRLSQADIEGKIGAQDGAIRPRLRFTAPTDAMELQTFVNTPAGVYSNMSGAE